MVNCGTEDWPDEPGNDELTLFAEELAAVLPTMSAAALRRTEERLWLEVAARARRRRQAITRHAGLAAAVLLGLIFGTSVFVPGGPQPMPPTDRSVRSPSEPVNDHFVLEGPSSPVSVLPVRPLIAADEQRSLFTHGAELRAANAARPETSPDGFAFGERGASAP